jgi:nucleotide-binding universal stress UspA family protein
MYHNILVPLDGTKRSEAILDLVKDMALSDQARVVLLKVEDPPILLGRDEVIDIPAYRKGREVCKAKDQSYLAELEEDFQKSGIEAQCQIACGSVVASILDTAESEKADLIAMSTRGINRFPREIGNSVAAGLLQKADRPLLIVRNEVER